MNPYLWTFLSSPSSKLFTSCWMWLAHDCEKRISKYYFYMVSSVAMTTVMFYELYQQESWLVQDSCWDNLYPVSKICNVPLLTKPLHHCHWTASYWPHPINWTTQKESEEREFRIHFEGMRRGGADRRETVDEEMKEKERDITSDRAQESKFPWSVISFLLLVTKSSLHPQFFHIAS